VTDHYAISDEHALSIARSIVANLNWREGTYAASQWDYEEPLFSAQEMGCIIPADTRKPFDIRKVCGCIIIDTSIIIACNFYQ